MTIEELVERYPEAVGFLSRRGIVCFVCGEPAWGTLAEQARRKGIEDIDSLVEELSRYIDDVRRGGGEG